MVVVEVVVVLEVVVAGSVVVVVVLEVVVAGAAQFKTVTTAKAAFLGAGPNLTLPPLGVPVLEPIATLFRSYHVTAPPSAIWPVGQFTTNDSPGFTGFGLALLELTRAVNAITIEIARTTTRRRVCVFMASFLVRAEGAWSRPTVAYHLAIAPEAARPHQAPM